MTNPAACARGNATPTPDALLGPVSRYLCALGWVGFPPEGAGQVRDGA